MAAIQIDNLSYSYPPSVFSNLSLQVNKGEIFGLLGPNGGGKSTLFGILCTRLKLQDGTISIFGTSLSTNSSEFRKKLGVVFQNPSLDRKLTLNENLIHQGHLYGIKGTTLHTKINEILEKLSIADRKNDLVEKLSGGLQRRGEIAKSLLHNPSLLILDEPSTGLDPGARRDLWDILFDLKKSGVTILLTTHLMEEGDRCDRLAILHKGEIKALGSPDQLKSKIGGDVISLQSEDPSSLSKKIKEKFGNETLVIDQTVRIDKNEGHKFLPQLIEAFPGLIKAATVGKPTLEDVFVRETGHRFWNEAHG